MKFDDLKPGMLIDDVGLIFKTGRDPFWDDSEGRFISFMDLNDPYIGPVSRAVRNANEEFVEKHPIGSDAYKGIVRAVIDERMKAANDAENDINMLFFMLNHEL